MHVTEAGRALSWKTRVAACFAFLVLAACTAFGLLLGRLFGYNVQSHLGPALPGIASDEYVFLVTERMHEAYQWHLKDDTTSSGEQYSLGMNYARAQVHRDGAIRVRAIAAIVDPTESLRIATMTSELLSYDHWTFSCELGGAGLEGRSVTVRADTGLSDGAKYPVLVFCDFDMLRRGNLLRRGAMRPLPKIESDTASGLHLTLAAASEKRRLSLRSAEVPLFWEVHAGPLPSANATACVGPIYSTVRDPQVKQRTSLGLWWMYHLSKGIERAVVYSREHLIHTERATQRLTDTGMTVVDAALPHDVSERLINSSRPIAKPFKYYYTDQHVMYNHCAVKYGALSRWIFPFDTDEFLVLPHQNGTQKPSLPEYLAGLESMSDRVAVVNVPRVSLTSCTTADGGAVDDVLDEIADAIGTAAARDVLGSLRRCVKKNGVTYQKNVFRPERVYAIDTHYANFDARRFESAGTFVDWAGNRDVVAATYDGPLLYHSGNTSNEELMWRVRGEHAAVRMAESFASGLAHADRVAVLFKESYLSVRGVLCVERGRVPGCETLRRDVDLARVGPFSVAAASGADGVLEGAKGALLEIASRDHAAESDWFVVVDSGVRLLPNVRGPSFGAALQGGLGMLSRDTGFVRLAATSRTDGESRCVDRGVPSHRVQAAACPASEALIGASLSAFAVTKGIALAYESSVGGGNSSCVAGCDISDAILSTLAAVERSSPRRWAFFATLSSPHSAAADTATWPH